MIFGLKSDVYLNMQLRKWLKYALISWWQLKLLVVIIVFAGFSSTRMYLFPFPLVLVFSLAFRLMFLFNRCGYLFIYFLGRNKTLALKERRENIQTKMTRSQPQPTRQERNQSAQNIHPDQNWILSCNGSSIKLFRNII